MNSFLMNSKEYEIQANNQLSSILSQFDEQYIMDIMDDTMQMRLNSFELMRAPMIVEGFEENFRSYMEVYPAQQELIKQRRADIYREIIDHICKRFDLAFTESDDLDLYTMAYYLYDFFISGFNQYLVNFYTTYINREKDNIYSSMGLESLSKNKDMSTNYGKMSFSMDKNIAVIVANLPSVLSNLRSIHITDDYILDTIYRSPDVTALFLNHILAKTPLFTIFNNILFNPHLYPIIITHIRLAFQMEYASAMNTEAVDKE